MRHQKRRRATRHAAGWSRACGGGWTPATLYSDPFINIKRLAELPAVLLRGKTPYWQRGKTAVRRCGNSKPARPPVPKTRGKTPARLLGNLPTNHPELPATRQYRSVATHNACARRLGKTPYCGIVVLCTYGRLHAIKAGHLARPRESALKNLFLVALSALSLSAAIVPLGNAGDFHNGSTGCWAATLTQQQGQL
jgi:hypothetical protein